MRIASLGEYLISLSKSIVLDQPAVGAAAKTAARSRLIPLLVINDVLHTDRYHPRSAVKNGLFSKEAMLCLPELVALAAAYISEPGSQAEKKLRALLNYWAVNHVLETDEIKSLRHHADESLLIAQGGTPVRKRNYLLPEYHGDRQAQWYDLPASYMLDQMIKQPHRPLDLRRVKPTKFDKKPVTPHVRNLLDSYFDNIDLKYVPTGDNPKGETKKYKLWLDPMGQLVKQHKDSGETSTVCNGYGWSAKLCRDVQKDGVPETIRLAREGAQHEAELESMRPVPQQRTSDNRYHSPPRRRRSSSLSDSDYKRGRGRRSRSHSRHSSRSSYDSRQDSRPGSRSNVRARSRSRRDTSPRRERHSSRERDRHHNEAQGHQYRPPPRPYGKGSSDSGQHINRSDAVWRNPSANAQYPLPPPPPNNAHGYQPPPPHPPPPPLSGPPFQSHPTMPNQFPGQFPMQPFPPPPPFQQGAFPAGIPPPPPPNYSGPFPPPPPNMAASPNAPYSFGGNPTNQGSNVGYGQNPNYRYAHGNHQSGQGGQGGRAGYRGNKQRGGSSERGGYGNQQRGHRGGWS